MSRPLFTVALPVRNGGPYLRPCVESILAQTCGDFELAILDNASTDGTADYLAGLRDPRVRLYPADRPLSITENWARIRTIPKQEFLTTIGHDDLLDAHFLATILDLIRAHPDAALYFTHFRLIDGEGQVLRRCRPMPSRETAAEFLAARLCMLRDSFGTGHVLRSTTYDALGGIPSFAKLLYADDALFLGAIGGDYRATALEEAFSYRLHAGSASGVGITEDTFTALEEYARFLDGLRGRDPAVAEVLARYFAGYAAVLARSWKNSTLLTAYLQRRPPASGHNRRAEDLTDLFGGNVDAADRWGTPSERLLEYATRSQLGRMIYGTMRLSQRLRGAGVQQLSQAIARKRATRSPRLDGHAKADGS